MLLEEYDEKAEREYLRKEAIEEGLERGIEQGIEQGMKLGIEQGIEQGIEGSVSILKKMGIPPETILAKIQEEYRLSPEEAGKYL